MTKTISLIGINESIIQIDASTIVSFEAYDTLATAHTGRIYGTMLAFDAKRHITLFVRNSPDEVKAAILAAKNGDDESDRIG